MTSTADRTAARNPAVPRKVPAPKPFKAKPSRTPTRRSTVPAQSPLVPGAIAAAWALGAGLVAITLPVLLIWAADGRSGADSVEATRTAGQLWLLAHGTSLTVPGGLVGLTPLGLTLLPLALLHRAGRHGVRQLSVVDTLQACQLLLAIAMPYAVVATALTSITGTEAVQPDPLRALAGALAVAVLGAGSGVYREARLSHELDVIPPLVRRLCAAAARAVAVLLAAGALLVIASLVLHHSQVASLSGATGPGLVGGTGLVVLQLLYAPNAVIWGASWLSGPGFAVGVGTHVSPWTTTLGQVPALPVLGALPSSDTPTLLVVVSVLIPLAAGVYAGVALSRTMARCSVRRAAFEGALVGPLAGLMMLGLAFISGGPMGGGRLVAVGPSAWQVALAVAVQLGAWSAATTAVLRWHRGS
jgi:hypothetical protein